jgi:putative Mg2+ transporter-C (MgtC) family protein
MISDQDILIRLIVAAILGAVVGFERERTGQPAGLRTHIILVVGATLTMTLSINLPIEFKNLTPNGDPSRLAAQVISGIGFLGAGAIFRYGPSVKGLTTATSLWTMAIVGLVVGAGHYLSAVAATTVILVALVVLNYFERKFIDTYTSVQITVTADNRISVFDEVTETIKKKGKIIGTPSLEKNFKSEKMEVTYTVRLSPTISVEPLIDAIGRIEGIRLVKLS